MSRYDPVSWHWCGACQLRVTQTHECPSAPPSYTPRGDEMRHHDSSRYVPSDDDRIAALSDAQIHSAQLTTAEYAVRERMPRGDLADLLHMLGIARPYTEQETTK